MWGRGAVISAIAEGPAKSVVLVRGLEYLAVKKPSLNMIYFEKTAKKTAEAWARAFYVDEPYIEAGNTEVYEKTILPSVIEQKYKDILAESRLNKDI